MLLHHTDINIVLCNLVYQEITDYLPVEESAMY